MLEVGSKVRVVNGGFYDTARFPVTGLEGVVVQINTENQQPIFEVSLVVDPGMGSEELGFYAAELEVIEEENE